MSDTREKLLDAAADAVREQGTAGASARVIAGRAGVNQALVFYHFGTVSDLVEAACRRRVDAAVAHYREQFVQVTTLTGLLEIGRELNVRERAAGNVALMAQLMAGAVNDPVLARAARYALDLWATEIEAVLTRVLHDSPVAELADPAGLARAISAAFIGLELYEGVDADGAAHALDALEHLAVLAEVVNDLGPVARRALKFKLTRPRPDPSEKPRPDPSAKPQPDRSAKPRPDRSGRRPPPDPGER